MKAPNEIMNMNDAMPHGESGVSRLTTNLPMLLRTLGAAALIFAMYSFLAKGWQNGNDNFRYLLLLSHTGILAAIGIVSSHYLKESKGARLFLILALVSVPVNFAILGAFIYAQTTLLTTTHAATYPGYVTWSVDSLNAALITGAGSLLVLVPVVLLGFSVLARRLSTQLSFIFLLNNAALLLPIRDPEIIGLLVLALTLSVIITTRKLAHNQTDVKTSEGMIALSLQLLPLSVLAIRNLWLYSPDAVLFTVFCLTAFLLIRQGVACLEADSKVRSPLDMLMLALALCIIAPLGFTLADSAWFPQSLVLPACALISAVMIYDISRNTSKGAQIYRSIAVSVLLLGQIINLIMFDGLLVSLTGIAIGGCMLVYGANARQRSVFLAGLILVLTGSLQQLFMLTYRFDLGSWASFTLLGIIAIITASVIESQGARIKQRIATWKQTFRQWEQ